jgi:hypothetical protein
MLVPRAAYLRQYSAKFGAESVLRLQAAQVRLDFSADEVLVCAAGTMRISAHKRQCARDHGLQAADRVFADGVAR